MPNPDLILYNGRIYPQASPRVRFQALAIWKGRVTDLGSDREILKLKSRFTDNIDLRGHTALPGFSDSHIHLLSYGRLLRTLDLSKTRSVEELTRRVAKIASSKAAKQWIIGRGWDDEKLREHRYPNRHDLDTATSNPVFLKRVCGHVAVANSTALAAAGIGSDMPDLEGGLILRDPKGTPNGVLKERAIELVENKIPESRKEIAIAIVQASRRLARLGLTSLGCIVGDLNELRALMELKREGKILQSIYAIIPLGLLDQLIPLGLSTEKSGGDFRIGGVKLYLDGSLGGHTAALTAPYSDDPTSTGMLTMGPEQLEQAALAAKEGNFQLCIHAIGDRAVELAIQILRSVFGAVGCRRLRHRIEHASLISRESVSEMRKLGIIASVQPRFVYSDSWARHRLGSDRLNRLYPFASMMKAGILLASGSDCPVEDPNPFEGVWSAVTRPGLDSGERLSVSAALATYTANAAYASFSENLRGTLDPGKAADLVVVDRDPFESSPQTIRETKVLKTMIGGVVVA